MQRQLACVKRLADVSMQKALADGPAAVCLECYDDQAMQTCLECAMPLCEECGIGHKRSKKTKTHVLKRFENASLVTRSTALAEDGYVGELRWFGATVI